jgi:hypothetical protein
MPKSQQFWAASFVTVDSEGRAADEAVLNKVLKKIQKIPIFKSEFSMSEIFAFVQLQQCIQEFPCKLKKTIRQIIQFWVERTSPFTFRKIVDIFFFLINLFT